ncbi:IS110 family transposase [Enterococcus sp. 5B3_DIV0040]|uniref:IS110 family transposase n=1 Tax=Enterococcus sp. 5B3_DIV0040 TaxID=1834182 RepID=UPI000A34FEA4|nr:IS110 family transposase [Enterococcus sp. 5B3_DIV0040]
MSHQDENPYYRLKYERIAKRRCKKRVIIARMMLTAIYHMLSTGKAWNPTDLYKIDMPDNLVQKQKDKAVKQASKLLISVEVLPDDFVRKDLTVST